MTRQMSKIQHPREFFHKLGGLHDSTVDVVEWRGATVSIWIDDFHSAFLGLPEYQGPLSGAIALTDVEAFALNVDPYEEPLTIYGIDVAEHLEGDRIEVTIRLAPGGTMRIRCRGIESVSASGRVAPFVK